MRASVKRTSGAPNLPLWSPLKIVHTHPMKVLVTGGAGFIGSHIVDALVARGDDVLVIDSETANNDQFYKNPGARYIKDTILNEQVVNHACQDREYVFHLAAESRIGPAIENPRYACEVNVVGTCTVLQAARHAKVKGVVYSSTSSAYGLKNQPPLREDMPWDNLNPYATSKLAGEDLALMFSKLYGLPTVALRYFNVFGERSPTRGQYAPVVGIFLRQALANEPLTVVGDGLQRRDFVHVSDVVQANLLAAEHASSAQGQVFNVGTGSSDSVLELAQMFGRPIQHLPPRPGEARHTEADISRIVKALGYRPKVTIKGWLSEELAKRGITAPR